MRGDERVIQQLNDEHVQSILEGILYLESTPNVDVMPVPRISASIKTQLVTDLGSELDVVSQ